MKLLDCTLRDGGYYNNWDFDQKLVNDYLEAMSELKIDFVEIGFRSLKNDTYKGACAYSTESYLNTLNIPIFLEDKIGVMINGSELINENKELQVYQNYVLSLLFDDASKSMVSLVRIACHLHEVEKCLPASRWLKERGYKVGFNIMSIAQATQEEIVKFGELASHYDIDVLYFADSMGSLKGENISAIITSFKETWSGNLGIHTHDNMGEALSNSLVAIKEGVTWIDTTVTGMGRGPGNLQTEYLMLALEPSLDRNENITKLLEIIYKEFKPLQEKYKWGMNPYYFLAGKYSIHPSYIQTMLADSRYNEEDILSVIEHLKVTGGKKYSLDTLESARHFYIQSAQGSGNPEDDIQAREVLSLGTGPSANRHKEEIENYIKHKNPYVISLNTQKSVSEDLVNIRAACHPIRLLADCHEYQNLKQPLVTPFSMLPKNVQSTLKNKKILDFGLSVEVDKFKFENTYAILPTSLVIAYALAIATSGKAKRILLSGFDGYNEDDSRNHEMDTLFALYQYQNGSSPIFSITPTRYRIKSKSIYGLLNGEKR